MPSEHMPRQLWQTKFWNCTDLDRVNNIILSALAVYQPTNFVDLMGAAIQAETDIDRREGEFRTSAPLMVNFFLGQKSLRNRISLVDHLATRRSNYVQLVIFDTLESVVELAVFFWLWKARSPINRLFGCSQQTIVTNNGIGSNAGAQQAEGEQT